MHIIVSLSCRLGHGNWCTWVKYILTTTNLLHIWEEQYFDNNYLLVLKERLFHDYKQHMQQTLENIQNSEMYPKLRIYRLFKQEYKLENYLQQLKDLRYIKVLITFLVLFYQF